jgi:hypothetical protein
VPFEWFTSQMNWVSPLLGSTAHAGLEDELVLGDADGGAHDAVGALLSLPDGASAQNATQRDPVLGIQAGYVDGSVAHGSSLASIYR